MSENNKKHKRIAWSVKVATYYGCYLVIICIKLQKHFKHIIYLFLNLHYIFHFIFPFKFNLIS